MSQIFQTFLKMNANYGFQTAEDISYIIQNWPPIPNSYIENSVKRVSTRVFSIFENTFYDIRCLEVRNLEFVRNCHQKSAIYLDLHSFASIKLYRLKES